jgi:carbohydrate-selective porin OprB
MESRGRKKSITSATISLQRSNIPQRITRFCVACKPDEIYDRDRPFSLRPKDDIAFAVGTTHVNDRLADVQALENTLGLGPVGVQHFEYVFEAYYTFAVADGLLLRPNVQYIVDPGAVDRNKDVIVVGLKTSATF